MRLLTLVLPRCLSCTSAETSMAVCESRFQLTRGVATIAEEYGWARAAMLAPNSTCGRSATTCLAQARAGNANVARIPARPRTRSYRVRLNVMSPATLECVFQGAGGSEPHLPYLAG